MQLAAHLAFQGLVDELMLLHPRLAAERGRDHGRRIVVAVAGKVADRHHGVGDAATDQLLDFACVHRHARFPLIRPLTRSTSSRHPPYRPATTPHGAHVTRLAESAARREASMRYRG